MVRVVVADDADVRVLARLVLSYTGHFEVVGEASDGTEAVSLAEDLRPDVVLLDLMMPGKSGWEALPEIRNRLPGTKVVIWSAAPVAADDEIRLRRLGAAAVVAKSRPPEHLRAIITSIAGEG